MSDTLTPEEVSQEIQKKIKEDEEAIVVTSEQKLEEDNTKDGDEEVRKTSIANYEDFKLAAEAALLRSHSAVSNYDDLILQRNFLLNIDKLDDEQIKKLEEVNQSLIDIQEEKNAQKIVINSLLDSGFEDQDLDGLTESLTNMINNLYPNSELNPEDAVDSEPVNLDALFILIEEKKKKFQFQEKMLQTLIIQIVGNQDNPQLLDQLIEDFDREIIEHNQDFHALSEQLNNWNNTKDNDDNDEEVLARSDIAINISNNIDTYRKKIDLVKVRRSKYKEALQEKTIAAAKKKIEEIAAEDGVEAEKVTTKLEKVLNFTDEGIDGLIKMNENSSVDTFIAFLIDPVNTRGKNGEKLRFGTTKIDNEQHEIIPVPLFREHFSNPSNVARALVISAQEINPTWYGQNIDKINDLKTFNKDTDSKKLKELLHDMYKELFIKSGSAEDNMKRFKTKFGAAIVNEPNSKMCLDKNSMLFFVESMKNDAEQLDKIWNIAS